MKSVPHFFGHKIKKNACSIILFGKVPHQMKCVPNDIFWIPDPSLVYNQPSAARERERAREIG